MKKRIEAGRLILLQNPGLRALVIAACIIQVLALLPAAFFPDHYFPKGRLYFIFPVLIFCLPLIMGVPLYVACLWGTRLTRVRAILLARVLEENEAPRLG